MENLDIASITEALEWKYSRDTSGDWKLVFKTFGWGRVVKLFLAGEKFDIPVASLKSGETFASELPIGESQKRVCALKSSLEKPSRATQATKIACLSFAESSQEARELVEKLFERIVHEGVSVPDSELTEREIENVERLVLEWTLETGGNGYGRPQIA